MRTFALGETIPAILGVVVAFVVLLTVQEHKLLYSLVSVALGVMGWIILLLYRFINYLVYTFWYIHETTTPLMDVLVSSMGGPKKMIRPGR